MQSAKCNIIIISHLSHEVFGFCDKNLAIRIDQLHVLVFFVFRKTNRIAIGNVQNKLRLFNPKTTAMKWAKGNIVYLPQPRPLVSSSFLLIVQSRIIWVSFCSLHETNSARLVCQKPCLNFHQWFSLLFWMFLACNYLENVHGPLGKRLYFQLWTLTKKISRIFPILLSFIFVILKNKIDQPGRSERSNSEQFPADRFHF